jgi:hypothetical protein
MPSTRANTSPRLSKVSGRHPRRHQHELFIKGPTAPARTPCIACLVDCAASTLTPPTSTHLAYMARHAPRPAAPLHFSPCMQGGPTLPDGCSIGRTLRPTVRANPNQLTSEEP